MIIKIIITVLNALFIGKCSTEYNKMLTSDHAKRLYGLCTWLFTEIIIIIWVIL